MKTVFIIAGFHMNITAADSMYADLRAAIVAKGYKVIPVPFVWNYQTVAQYIPKFVDFYQKYKGKHNIVIGNSYGAMVAFLAAPETQPDRVLLCSLSPYFVEDTEKTTAEYRIKRFGKRRNDAMKQLSAKDTAKAINQTNTQITLLYGEKEKEKYSFLVDRVKETYHDLTNAKLVEVPNAPHPFRNPAYIAGICKEL